MKICKRSMYTIIEIIRELLSFLHFVLSLTNDVDGYGMSRAGEIGSYYDVLHYMCVKINRLSSIKGSKRSQITQLRVVAILLIVYLLIPGSPMTLKSG